MLVVALTLLLLVMLRRMPLVGLGGNDLSDDGDDDGEDGLTDPQDAFDGDDVVSLSKFNLKVSFLLPANLSLSAIIDLRCCFCCG